MALDPVKNFAISRVATAPSPATSGTTLVVDEGDGALFPAPATSGEFNVVVYPNGEQPDSSNAEIVRVTARTADTLTIEREQEDTSARTIGEGDIVMLGITAKMVSDLSTAVTDVVTEAGTQTLTNKTLTSPKINEDVALTATASQLNGLPDGWIPAGETWAYASASTITVPSGAASKYQKGDKIKITNNSATKYFYIVSVADTVLTVSGGDDYTVHNSAITNPFYSKMENPQGFPLRFNYTPTISVSGGTAPSYASNECTFSISGSIVNVWGYLSNTTGGTAGTTTGLLTLSMPTGTLGYQSILGTFAIYEADIATLWSGLCRQGTSPYAYFMKYDATVNVSGADQSSPNRYLFFNCSYIMA